MNRLELIITGCGFWETTSKHLSLFQVPPTPSKLFFFFLPFFSHPLSFFLRFTISIFSTYCCVKPKITEIWQVEAEAKNRRQELEIAFKENFKVGAVCFFDFSPLSPNTLRYCYSFHPIFTLIGPKLIIFSSPTCFQKISLRSQVAQVPLSRIIPIKWI